MRIYSMFATLERMGIVPPFLKWVLPKQGDHASFGIKVEKSWISLSEASLRFGSREDTRPMSTLGGTRSRSRVARLIHA